MRLLGALAYAVVLTGCSLAVSLDGLTDGGGSIEQGTDGAIISADGQSFDGDASSQDSSSADDGGDGSIGDKDSGDGGGSGGFICGGTVVSDCSTCTGSPEPCITCDTSGDPYAFCETPGGTCRNDGPPPYNNSCKCSAPGDCFASFQVCQGNANCHTCGEPNSDGDACKGGGSCTASSATCH